MRSPDHQPSPDLWPQAPLRGRRFAPPTVAIVGGGASGTLVAVQLLRRHHPAGLRIVLVERRERVGRGLAYSTPWDFHRLNVPAREMGVLPRDPGHFLRWARRRGTELERGDFAPRSLFGEYLEELLCDAERAAFDGVALERIGDEAVALAVEDGPAARPTVRLSLRSGAAVLADVAVLALGNLPPPDPPGCDPDVLASERYERDPWDPALPARAARDGSVLVLGTGLTMVDLSLTLGLEEGPRVIHAVSRKGLLPRVHRADAPPALRPFELPREGFVLGDLVAEVAGQIDAAEDWREVIDSLRPVTNQIWTRLSEVDRRRFVQHLSRRWDVHRHRMAPEVAAMLADMRESDRLRVAAGGVEGMRMTDDGIAVSLRPEPGSEAEVLVVDRVINCTGPALDLDRVPEPLLQDLFAGGHVRSGPLRLGLDHDARGALVDWRGESPGLLFTLGPLRKGRLWETTAIPEIRAQAFELADQLTCALARVAERSEPDLAVA